MNDLHSIIVLLKGKENRIQNIEKLTFTFYYSSIKGNIIITSAFLSKKFTFYYSSIKGIIKPKFHNLKNKFTFYYSSIKGLINFLESSVNKTFTFYYSSIKGYHTKRNINYIIFIYILL